MFCVEESVFCVQENIRNAETEKVRQRKECCLPITLIPNSQSAGHCLEFSSTSSHHPPSYSYRSLDPKPPPLYQYKKMQHATFLFSLACNSPPNTPSHSPTASPFPTFVSVERHMVTAIQFPPAESAFHFTTVQKEVRVQQTEIL